MAVTNVESQLRLENVVLKRRIARLEERLFEKERTTETLGDKGAKRRSRRLSPAKETGAGKKD